MRKGQALVEYVLVAASLLVVVSILWGFVHVAIRAAIRAENLVASPYP